MTILIDLLFASLSLWLSGWRLLGDRDGWLALFNAWAWWLLTALLPAGVITLGRRSRPAGLGWLVAGAGLWLAEYGWTLAAPAPAVPAARWAGMGRTAPTRGASPPDTRRRSLSLLTFNLLNQPRALTPVFGLIQREGPDLLLLQECIPSHAAQLERGLADTFPYRLWLPAQEYGMGFGIASRLPFALTGFWQFPGFEPFAAGITLSPSPVPLDIYCVQFISPTNEVRREGPTALLRLRERQIDWVLAEIARRGSPALVAGDWNTTEGSDAYRRAAATLTDGWREAGRGPGWSWPRSLNPFVDRATPPLLRLDYVMHTGGRFGPGLSVAGMRVIREPLGSDHCPLLAQLEWSDHASFGPSGFPGY